MAVMKQILSLETPCSLRDLQIFIDRVKVMTDADMTSKIKVEFQFVMASIERTVK